MKIRQGRRNDRNLYLQLGDEPSDSDPCLGFMIDPEVGKILVQAVTSPWHLNEIALETEARIKHDDG